MNRDDRKVRSALAIALMLAVTCGCSHASSNDGTAASPTPAPVIATAVANATAAAGSSAPAPASSETATASSPAADFDAGPLTFDDDIVEPSVAQPNPGGPGAGTSSAGSAAAALLSSDPAPAPAASASADPLEANVRTAAATLPASEYSLDALVPRLSSDPAGLDVFVRDNVGLDLYDGVVRGALGTWLGRAGNPIDKVVLLAAVLRAKGLPVAFVRGTLSDAERAAIVKEADAAPPFVVEPQDSRQQTYLATRAAAGRRFATWIKPLLGTSVAAPAEATTAEHYWIRTTGPNGSIDLDPTLKATAPGAHLGTEDASEAATPSLPAALYATVDVRVRATGASGTPATVVETSARVADIGLTPIGVTVVPADTGSGADVTLLVGTRIAASNALAATGISELDLDVIRTTPAGTSSTISRRIFDSRTGETLSANSASVHTIVLCAESAPAFFAHVAFGDAAVLARVRAVRSANQVPGDAGLYPELLADFLASDDAMAATLGAQSGLRLYRDRPDVVMLHATMTRSGDSGVALATTFDIADNGMSASGARDAEVDANLARGWADTRIERDIMETHDGDAMGSWLAAKTQHASFAVGSSAATPTSFPSGVEVAQSGVADDHAFWWDVDATTGSAVGRGPGGYGQSEYGVMLRNAVTRIKPYFRAGLASYNIASAAKACLTNTVSMDCAMGIVGLMAMGYGAVGETKAAQAAGRVGYMVSAAKYLLPSMPDSHVPYPDPNAPNSCGMVCAPGDPSASDGDGP